MLSKISVIASFALSAALVARADVTPSEPGPGMVYNAGSTCTVSWTGDKDSATAWKDMNIELMTGSNFQMVHITTIATGQDGTVDGRVTYPCPEVNPYSAIYFYQFTATGATEKTWTTRFTIASPTGQVTPPSNANQPGTNDPIPWGTGALVDPSKAVPPPGPGVSVSPSGAGGASTSTGASSAATANTRTGDPAATPTGASRLATTSSERPAATSNATASQKTVENGADAVMGGASVILGSVIALVSSALALSL